jgi:choline dehydrogenase
VTTTTFDLVIVGGGTAGCLLANRLSRDPRYRVLLVEAGGRDNYPWIHIPVGYLYCIGNPRTDWQFKTEPEAGLHGRRILYPRGKTLGGCSSINGMIYMRGQSRDYAQWAEVTGDEAWSWQNVLPDFRVHESNFRLDGSQRGDDAQSAERAREFHGTQGEWRVEQQRTRWQILDAFTRAAEQSGIPRSADFNTGDNAGVGYFEVNQRRGFRWNTSKAFLRPVRHRPNLCIWTGAVVKKLRLQHDGSGALRCVGVELLHDGKALAVDATREVVLAAGAIGTPQLMQVSGLGPASLLKQHGVAPLADLPGVGANLQDHLQLRAVYKVKHVATLNVLASSYLGRLRIALQYLLTRRGPMSMAPSQLGAFVRSDAEQPWANLQFHIQPLSLDAFGQPLHPFPAITASVCNLNPTSRGSVRLRSPDILDAPAIAPNYLSTDADRRIAAASLRVTRNIMSQPALAAFEPTELRPGADCQTDAELIEQAGVIGTTIFHPAGTTRMGKRDDVNAVVDSHLRVHGVRGLRVVDASVMPTLLSGNICSPTLMIAEKGARWIAMGE